MGKRNYKFGKPIAFLKTSLGMTLTEVLVVVGILAIFILMAMAALKPNLQMEKARDSRRKSDLKKIATALEDYAGDHPCYPEEIYQDNSCEPTMEFGHYLKPISCDPLTHSPYLYLRPDGKCNQFIVYATLELKQTGGEGFYAVSSPNVQIIPTPVPTTATMPTTAPPGEGGLWGCKSGVCVPVAPGECPSINYWAEIYCKCENPANECH